MNQAQIQEILSIVDTDQLIRELRDRFDRMLFVGVRALDNSNYDIKLRWKDVPTDGIGLASYAARKISDMAAEAEAENAEDEDDDDQ